MLIEIIKSFLCCFVVDKLLLFCGDISLSRRYIGIHALLNWWIVYWTYADVSNCLQNSWDLDYHFGHSGVKVITYTIGLHLFDMYIRINRLAMDDIIHHIVSSFLSTAIIVYHRADNSPLTNVATFFMCGLPGAIDYTLLYFVKHDQLRSIDEKYINGILNMYIRLPGLLYCSLKCLEILQGNLFHELNSTYLIFIIVSTYINGVYFSKKVVENYSKCKTLLD